MLVLNEIFGVIDMSGGYGFSSRVMFLCWIVDEYFGCFLRVIEIFLSEEWIVDSKFIYSFNWC